ncbi:MAG: hypothetical protein LBQ95_03905 [Lachnospiraceae bacterium]|jgi:uncharacterized membrane protein (DUF2068 family)|nr:hypothetical protein [Lachnospiraceae bacterium]
MSDNDIIKDKNVTTPDKRPQIKKWQRFLALISAIILAALYICTLIFAIIKHPLANDLFKACVLLTIVVPVVIYGYILVYRIVKR